jgi:hypothetical protein
MRLAAGCLKLDHFFSPTLILYYFEIRRGNKMQINKLRGKELDQLFKAVLSLNDLEECYRFFDDLCTINEIQSLAQRLEVSRILR